MVTTDNNFKDIFVNLKQHGYQVFFFSNWSDQKVVLIVLYFYNWLFKILKYDAKSIRYLKILKTKRLTLRA